MHWNILSNGNVTILELLDKIAKRNSLFHKWKKMKLSVRLTGVKRICLRNIEKLKVHTLAKKECPCWWALLYGKIQQQILPTQLPLQQVFLPPSYCTESYIVAITDTAQTELDTLSADEIITKQVIIDHPHIQKLHKRTDNASNFLSHATPEVEWLICERVSRFLNYLTLIELHSVAWY